MKSSCKVRDKINDIAIEKSYITVGDKRNFVITFLVAALCNIQYIANELPFADFNVCSEYHFSGQWELSLGRWLLPYLDHMRWGITGSVLSSILAVVWLAIGGVLLNRIFAIHNRALSFMLNALLGVSPFFYDTLASYHCSSEYMFGFLLAIAGVYCTMRFEGHIWSIIVGGILIACSLGIYQAYLGVSCGLYIFTLIKHTLENNKTVRLLLKELLNYVSAGVTGLVLYFLNLRINLKIWNVQMSDYAGANTSIVSRLCNIPFRLIDALKACFHYYFTDEIINNGAYGRGYWNAGILIVAIIAIIIIIIHWKDKMVPMGKIGNIGFMILCIGLIPIALGIIEVVVSEKDINQLMSAPYVLMYVFALYTIDVLAQKQYINRLLLVIMTLPFIGIIHSCFAMDNASSIAIKMNMNKQKTVAMSIMDTIISTDSCSIDDPILFIGTAQATNSTNSFLDNSSEIYHMASGESTRYGQIWESPSDISNRAWYHFIRHQLGVSLNLVQDTDKYNDIIHTTEFARMPTYPEKGYIDMIDGIWVVKLESNPDKE